MAAFQDFFRNLSQFADANSQSTQREQQQTRALANQIGGIYIGPQSDSFSVPLALNDNYLQMIANARKLADQQKPCKKEARAVLDVLVRYWLTDVHAVLDRDRYQSVSMAESLFGFNLEEDPQMTRLETTYQFHCGVIGLVFEVALRSNIASSFDVVPTQEDSIGERPAKKPRLGFRQRGQSQQQSQIPANPAGSGEAWLDRRMEVSRQLHKVIEVVYHLYELLHAVFRSVSAVDPSEPVFRPVNEFDLMRFSHVPDELNSFQALVVSLSRHFVHMRYRRDGEMICREQMLPGAEPGKLLHTHYWKPIKSIREAVTAFCDKNRHGNAWSNATKVSSNFDGVVKYFTEGRDDDLPPVSRWRRLFSFHNGLLLLGRELPNYCGPPIRPDGHGRFFFYTGSDISLSASLVSQNVHSSRLFKSDFPEEFAEMLNSGEPMKPNILMHTSIPGSPRFHPTAWPTPLFDSLLERQGFSFFQRPYNPDHVTIPVVSSLFQIYAMLGRLLYKVGELDNYQVGIFFLGIAGTGKSIICEIISKFYGKESIGKLSSNCQTTFAISSLLNKHIIICPEVKHNFGLAASDYQSMVTGESVTVNRKHMETVTMHKFVAQTLFTGNDLPPWADALGAIFRRIFCVRMENAVRDDQVDTTISRKLRIELPSLLIKFHACYIQMLEDFGDVSFWSFADEKFRKAREVIEQELNPTKKFLFNGDILDRDESGDRDAENFSIYMPYARFMELCTDWCKKQNITLRSSSSNREQQTKKIFDDSHYGVHTMNLPFGNGLPPRQAMFVLGVTDLSAPLQLPPNWRSLIVVPVK
jgi:hypothetical protein